MPPKTRLQAQSNVSASSPDPNPVHQTLPDGNDKSPTASTSSFASTSSTSRNAQANAPFCPPADTSTYRDLLLFEERLKMNAEMLRRRRRRYSAFLWSFVVALMYLSHWLMFLPPRAMLALRALQASVAVVFITLALFFASGMYEEKIRYAHSYINHSNRALRPLNMHLNLRRPRFTLPSLLPAFLRPSPATPLKPVPVPTPAAKPTGSTSNPRRLSTNATIMGQIPPSSNPRGELIFASRVDRSFREGYERYRSAFERRREEKAREEARRAARSWFKRGLSDPGAGMNRILTPTPPASRKGTPPPGLSGATLNRGRSPSPGVSRLGKETFPSNGDDGIKGEKENTQDGKRERADSDSFVWSSRPYEGPPKRAP